ncbi:RPP1 Ribonuclease P/MRP protein subunit RPP1 [Candida maltosa Xu316]
MTYDLNIPWPCNDYTRAPSSHNLINLKNTIVTNYSLGVTHQVINFTINDYVKIPLNTPDKINPIPVTNLLKELKPQFPKLRLFSRLTIVVNDSSKLPTLTKLTNHFDIIAVQPTNEKAFQLTVLNLEVDLISINLGSKLSFFLKHKVLNTAIEKGIKFEINYSTLVSGDSGYSTNDTNVNMIKKNFFNNAIQLIRGVRSRGLVISSGAQNPLQLRNVNDIIILLSTLGLDKNKSKTFIIVNPERVLINGKLKSKSHRQTVVLNDENFVEENNGQGYKKKLEDTSSGRLLKKRKVQS